MSAASGERAISAGAGTAAGERGNAAAAVAARSDGRAASAGGRSAAATVRRTASVAAARCALSRVVNGVAIVERAMRAAAGTGADAQVDPEIDPDAEEVLDSADDRAAARALGGLMSLPIRRAIARPATFSSAAAADVVIARPALRPWLRAVASGAGRIAAAAGGWAAAGGGPALPAAARTASTAESGAP